MKIMSFKRIKKHFRRENLKFTIKLIGSLFGFLITNFSLIQINDFTNYKVIILLLVCIACFFLFMLQIYYKYEYYHGLAIQLQKNDKPLFLMCSYISKSFKRKNDKKINNFKIIKMDIIYDIDIPKVFTAEESNIDFTITYCIEAKNNSEECSKVYHVSLSQNDNNNIRSECKFEDEQWSVMQKDSYYHNDKNLNLWYAIKSGDPLRANQNFTYYLRIKYTNSYSALNDNRFLIHPANYGNEVNEIRIIVRSKEKELGKLVQTPQIISYYNGMNTNDKSGQSKFQMEQNPDYKTYFVHTVKPDIDSLYVLEISPKHNPPLPM